MATFDNSQKAAVYASLILHDEGLPITAENILKATQAAGIKIERIWADLFEKTFKGKDIGELLLKVTSGSTPAAPQAAQAPEAQADKKDEKSKKAESESESDGEMGMGLFD